MAAAASASALFSTVSSSSSFYSRSSNPRSSPSKFVINWPVEGHLWSANVLFTRKTDGLKEKHKKRLQIVSLATSLNDLGGSTNVEYPVGEELDFITEELKNNIDHLPTETAQGKPGFISFQSVPYQKKEEDVVESMLVKEPLNFQWFIGPTVLVASFVFPSVYMRKIVLFLIEDSLFTDFLILFFNEAIFYGGAAIFVLLIDHTWKPLQVMIPTRRYFPKPQFGLGISYVTILVFSLIIPLATMGMVWPWTGPAASATLAPYLVGLIVQFAFEKYSQHRKSTAWPVIPIIFQIYRLHQLNRAAQLVTALSFSVRGAENTAQTLAINNSLGILLNVLQLLGVICIWSLSSFLMRFIPSPIMPSK